MKKLFLMLLLGWIMLPSVNAQQTRTLRGTITDAASGEALPGVSLIVQGTQTGTSTDASGAYSLSLPAGATTLVVSYVGYVSQTLEIGTQSTLNLSLEADTKALEEVVVVGYGTVKKTDLTGSVATLDPAQITKRGALNPMEAVQGQVAGVDISNSTGRAGAGFRIQIRGQQSLSGGNPLYVVDGVITGGIDFLNPQDIERIDILKDASSTAIYGSRGAYGVVLVTTKQGSSVKQKAVVSYDGYVGVRQAARMPDFMDGDTWWNFRQDAYITPALLQNQSYNQNIGNNTNSDELRRRVAEKDYTFWPDLFIQNGSQVNHWITASGMSNKMGYTFGAGYQHEKGNIVHEEYKRYNFKASINHALNERWTAGTTFNLSVVDQEMGSNNAMLNAFRMPPLLKPTGTATGELIIQPGKDLPYIDMTSSVNPLFEMENSLNDTRTYYAIGNVFLQYAPVEGLSFKTTFAPRFKYEKNGQMQGTNTEGRINLLPAASISNTESFSYVWDNQVTFNKSIKEHNFNVMGLYSLNLFRDETNGLSAIDLPFNSGYHNLGTAPPDKQRSTSYFQQSTIMSYALRANYGWRDKYLLTVSTRWDGASVLAEGHKWATFPSAALAWRISEEEFMSGVRFVNSLKLRLSYGVTGNNTGVRPYDTQIRANTNTLYDFGGTIAGGTAPSGVVNRRLTWEKTNEVNAGLDYDLFKGRVSGTIDYYDKVTNGILLNRNLPLETGWGSLADNIGKVRNAGVEFSLTTLNVSTPNFTWQTSLNFSRNRNEILSLVDKNDDVGNKWFIGQPVRVNYTYVFDGIWQENQRELATTFGQLPGQVRVRDINNDGKITPLDRQIIGNPFPDWTGGLSTTLTFWNFDFSASLFARQGVQVFSPFHEEFLHLGDRGRAKLNVEWYMAENNVTPTRYSNQYPQPNNMGNFWRGTEGVGSYQDASFVKIKNLTLGYTFPTGMLEKVRISSLRLYSNVLNPFVFSKFTGFDPEWADASYANGGVSFVTYQFGVNVKF
ncbi:TonB-dependent receptor [Rhabdobacter roseus]|uniref:TonB-linked SusC/RagA family outer membrane protein n=1 Tax=Rhabdobacter roseus TaxID=1655419 RepID=A0A840TR72_9BACT|nr:TonB-dependent receptor [Rhabdobacter roseus]MBB5283733.1 TonB-linked SusC/RagA family outer membrane protein [Rhabdobacter roseus]